MVGGYRERESMRKVYVREGKSTEYYC